LFQLYSDKHHRGRRDRRYHHQHVHVNSYLGQEQNRNFICKDLDIIIQNI